MTYNFNPLTIQAYDIIEIDGIKFQVATCKILGSNSSQCVLTTLNSRILEYHKSNDINKIYQNYVTHIRMNENSTPYPSEKHRAVFTRKELKNMLDSGNYYIG